MAEDSAVTAAASAAAAAAADQLLFGSGDSRAASDSDISRWQSESFVFSSSVVWGLRQTVGGPCGVLAPVQAFLLRHLIDNAASPLHPTEDERREALASALAAMIWRCRGGGGGNDEATTAVWQGAAHTSLASLSSCIAGAALEQPGAVLAFVRSVRRLSACVCARRRGVNGDGGRVNRWC